MDNVMDVAAGPSDEVSNENQLAVRAVRMRSKSKKSKRGRSKSKSKKKKSKSKSRSRKSLKRKRSKSSKRSRSKKRKSSKSRKSRSKSRKSRGRKSKSKSKGRKRSRKSRGASKKRRSRSKSRKSKSKRRGSTKRRRSATKKRRLSRVAAQALAAPMTKRRRRKAEDIDNMLISQVRLVPKELKKETLKSYMKKMLHKSHPKISMKRDTLEMVDNLMKNCMDYFANQATEKIGKNKKTLTAKHMSKAIRKLLPKTLRKNVDAKGNDALRQFARASGN